MVRSRRSPQQTLKTKCLRKLLHMYYLSIGPKIGCGARSAPLWVQRNLFWQLSRDRNLHGSGMSHATTAPKKKLPSGHFGGWALPWLAEEVPDGQQQKVAIPSHARAAHKGFLQKRLEEDLC